MMSCSSMLCKSQSLNRQSVTVPFLTECFFYLPVSLAIELLLLKKPMIVLHYKALYGLDDPAVTFSSLTCLPSALHSTFLNESGMCLLFETDKDLFIWMHPCCLAGIK